MKNIESVPLWSEGSTKSAEILNCYGINVALNNSATFWYGLHAKNEDGSVGALLAQGNKTMSQEEYDLWNDDEYAWSWIAQNLGLSVVSNYVAPEPEIIESPVLDNQEV